MDSRQSGELERERSKRPVGRRDAFGTVDEAIESFSAGRMVIVVDDEDRENEGDLIIHNDPAYNGSHILDMCMYKQ